MPEYKYIKWTGSNLQEVVDFLKKEIYNHFNFRIFYNSHDSSLNFKYLIPIPKMGSKEITFHVGDYVIIEEGFIKKASDITKDEKKGKFTCYHEPMSVDKIPVPAMTGFYYCPICGNVSYDANATV